MSTKRDTARDSAHRMRRHLADYAMLPGMPYSIFFCLTHDQQARIVKRTYWEIEQGNGIEAGFSKDYHRRIAKHLVFENLNENKFFQRAENLATRMGAEPIQAVDTLIEKMNLEALDVLPIHNNEHRGIQQIHISETLRYSRTQDIGQDIAKSIKKIISQKDFFAGSEELGTAQDPAEAVWEEYKTRSSDRNIGVITTEDLPEGVPVTLLADLNSTIRRTIQALFVEYADGSIPAEEKKQDYLAFAHLLRKRLAQQFQQPRENFDTLRNSGLPNQELIDLLTRTALDLPLFPELPREEPILKNKDAWTLGGTYQMLYYDGTETEGQGRMSRDSWKSSNAVVEQGLEKIPYVIPVPPLEQGEKLSPIQKLYLAHQTKGMNHGKIYVGYSQAKEEPFFCDGEGQELTHEQINQDYSPEPGRPLFVLPCPSHSQQNDQGKTILQDPTHVDPPDSPKTQFGVRAEGTLYAAALNLCPDLAVAGRVNHRTDQYQTYDPRPAEDHTSVPTPMLNAMLVAGLLAGRIRLMNNMSQIARPSNAPQRGWVQIRNAMLRQNSINPDTFLGNTDFNRGIPELENPTLSGRENWANIRFQRNQSRASSSNIPQELYPGKSICRIAMVIPPDSKDGKTYRSLTPQNYQNLTKMLEELYCSVRQSKYFQKDDWVEILYNESVFGADTASEHFQKMKDNFSRGQYNRKVRFVHWDPADGTPVDLMLLNPPDPKIPEHYELAKELSNYLANKYMMTLFLSHASPVPPDTTAIYDPESHRRRVFGINGLAKEIPADSEWYHTHECNPFNVQDRNAITDLTLINFRSTDSILETSISTPEETEAAVGKIVEIIFGDTENLVRTLETLTRKDAIDLDKKITLPLNPLSAHNPTLGDVMKETEVLRKPEPARSR